MGTIYLYFIFKVYSRFWKIPVYMFSFSGKSTKVCVESKIHKCKTLVRYSTTVSTQQEEKAITNIT